MAIVTLKGLDQFMNWTSEFGRERYKCILTKHGEVFLRPVVTTKGVDTLHINYLPQKDVELLKKF